MDEDVKGIGMPLPSGKGDYFKRLHSSYPELANGFESRETGSPAGAIGFAV